MSSKKGKKPKGKTLSLQEFTASLDGTPSGPGQNVVYAPAARKVMSSWADEVEEDELITAKERIVLPSAPRAARGPAYDDSMIPRAAPFTIHLGNLNYDIGEEDVHNFFQALVVKELRLPRDGNNRLRGFGYVEFEARADLVEALCMNEQMLRGRPVRISLGQGSDKDKDGRQGQRRQGGGNSFVDETPEDWRSTMSAGGRDDSGPPPRSGGDFGGRGGGYRDFGRDNYNRRDNDDDFSRGGGFREYGRDRNNYNRRDNDDFGGRGGAGGYGGRDYGRDRDNYNRREVDDFQRPEPMFRRPPPPPLGQGFENPHADRQGPRRGSGGGFEQETSEDWRSSMSASREDFGRPGLGPRSGGDFPREREGRGSGYRERDHGRDNYNRRDNEDEFRNREGRDAHAGNREVRRDNSYNRKNSEEVEAPARRTPSPPRERKKLVLAPRTVPKDSPSETPVANSAIFGGAKPVDTAAKEREIERKLEQMAVTEPQPPRQIRSPPADRDDRGSSRDKSPVPPPPVTNPWNKQRERPRDEIIRHDRERESYHRRSSDESSPPDECKDTNSEPEDERDLRDHGSASDSEFQTVSGRKPRNRVSRGGGSEEPHYNNRGGSGYNRGHSQIGSAHHGGSGRGGVGGGYSNSSRLGGGSGGRRGN